MNTLIRYLSSACVVSLSVAILATPSRLEAFGGPPGGPFGNGSYFPTEGTFQATLRAMNLSGVATFNSDGGGGNVTPGGTQVSQGFFQDTVTTTESVSSTGGFFTVFYEGTSYVGNVDGGIDPSAGSISAVLEGINRGSGNQTTEVVSPQYTTIGTVNVDGGTSVVREPDQVIESSQYDSNNQLVSRSETRFTGLTREIFNPDSVADEMGWVDTITTYNYTDSFYASGYFNAKLKNSFPNQVLKGSGSLNFTSIDTSKKEPVLQVETVPFSIRGVRISNQSSDYQALNISRPTIITTETIQNRDSASSNSTQSN